MKYRGTSRRRSQRKMMVIVGFAAGVAAWTAALVAAAKRDPFWAEPGVQADFALERGGVVLRDWEWKGRVAPGATLEIKGVNGDIRAARTSGGLVQVVATVSAERSDPDDVRLEVVEHDDGVTICAVYPSADPDVPGGCRPGSGDRGSALDNDVSVQFGVELPSGVGLIARTVNGDIEALDIQSDVRAHTVNGSVDISTTGLVAATTVNGSINASMGKADWIGTITFSAVSGSIVLDFPADLNSSVSLSTINGQISTDYPVTVEGRFSPRRLDGIIGSGGRTLIAKTVNGGVAVRRW